MKKIKVAAGAARASTTAKSATTTAAGKPQTRTNGKAAVKSKSKKPATRRMAGGEGGGEVICFQVPITPRPKERARTYADHAVLLSAFREARGDAGKFMQLVSVRLMRTVTPESTRFFEAAIASHASAAMARLQRTPFDVPLEMSADFVLAGTGEEWPVAHADGDLDNMEKALLDGLNGIVWVDDRLVVSKQSRKLTGITPHILVRIWPSAAHPRLTENGDGDGNEQVGA